ncbi:MULTISPECIES: hypothetical protein, partial [unclassified Neisseria]
LGCPKVVRVKAAAWEVTGPSSMAIPAIPFFKMTGNYKLQYQLKNDDGMPYANKKYTLILADYQKIEGVTDQYGMTQIFYSETGRSAEIHLHLDERTKNG